MAFSTSTSTVSSEINITPLIDVLLVLLIIFMVLVPLKPQGLQSAIPQGKSKEQAQLPVQVSIAPGQHPTEAIYRINDRSVSLTEIKPALAALFATRDDHTLYLKADRDLDYQQVATVVSYAHQAGAGAIALGALPKTDMR